jgi:hypothetical protein
MDRKVIDGIINGVGHITGLIGEFLRSFIDKPIINGFGDWVGITTKKLGFLFRPIQTGRVQQYMIIALVSMMAFSAIFYYLLVFTR